MSNFFDFMGQAAYDIPFGAGGPPLYGEGVQQPEEPQGLAGMFGAAPQDFTDIRFKDLPQGARRQASWNGIAQGLAAYRPEATDSPWGIIANLATGFVNGRQQGVAQYVQEAKDLEDRRRQQLIDKQAAEQREAYIQQLRDQSEARQRALEMEKRSQESRYQQALEFTGGDEKKAKIAMYDPEYHDMLSQKARVDQVQGRVANEVRTFLAENQLEDDPAAMAAARAAVTNGDPTELYDWFVKRSSTLDEREYRQAQQKADAAREAPDTMMETILLHGTPEQIELVRSTRDPNVHNDIYKLVRKDMTSGDREQMKLVEQRNEDIESISNAVAGLTNGGKPEDHRFVQKAETQLGVPLTRIAAMGDLEGWNDALDTLKERATAGEDHEMLLWINRQPRAQSVQESREIAAEDRYRARRNESSTLGGVNAEDDSQEPLVRDGDESQQMAAAQQEVNALLRKYTVSRPEMEQVLRENGITQNDPRKMAEALRRHIANRETVAVPQPSSAAPAQAPVAQAAPLQVAPQQAQAPAPVSREQALDQVAQVVSQLDTNDLAKKHLLQYALGNWVPGMAPEEAVAAAMREPSMSMYLQQG